MNNISDNLIFLKMDLIIAGIKQQEIMFDAISLRNLVL